MVQTPTGTTLASGTSTGSSAADLTSQTQPHGAADAGATDSSGTFDARIGSYRGTGSEGGQIAANHEIVLVDEQRTRPATATIVGAALAGAVAGAAIPFMLAGRSASRKGTAPRATAETVVTESLIVDRPARELYDFWRDFTNLPQFMDNIQSVETLDRTRSHWVIKAPAGTSVEFDSRVIDDVPGRSISWQSEEGATVPNRGRVEFIETASGTGTNVRATISYDPPAGAAGRLVAKLFGREPSVQAREDLARFKRLMEARTGA